MARADVDLLTQLSKQPKTTPFTTIGECGVPDSSSASNAGHGFAECTERLTVCDHIYQPASEGPEGRSIIGTSMTVLQQDHPLPKSWKQRRSPSSNMLISRYVTGISVLEF